MGAPDRPAREPAAIEAIFQASGALPRKINQLAHYEHAAAAVAKAKSVSAEHVTGALAEVSQPGTTNPSNRRMSPKPHADHANGELLAIEEVERTRRSLDRRVRNATRGSFKPMARFDWNWPTKLDRQAIDEIFGLGFINAAENAVFVGPNGIGTSPGSTSGCLVRWRSWHAP